MDPDENSAESEYMTGVHDYLNFSAVVKAICCNKNWFPTLGYSSIMRREESRNVQFLLRVVNMEFPFERL